MKIKCFVAAIAAAVLSCVAIQAQTPEEVVKKMSAQLDRADAEGFTMDLIMKMPIVGEVRSHNMMRGKKMKMEVSGKDKSSIVWQDATTMWSYDKNTGVITISSIKPSTSTSDKDSDLSGFDNITDGYDVTLKDETPDAWYYLCKKKKTNKDKDDPKTMDLAVSKKTFLPLYLRMKKSVVTVGLENITIGVSEESVTFNPSAFPNVRIEDKR